MSISFKEIYTKFRVPRDQDQGNQWLHCHFYSWLSVPITAFLLRLPISGNQVTVMWIIIGMIGVLLLAVPTKLIGLVGCGCLLLHTILDLVDGNIARIRSEVSSSGIFLDRIGHDLILPASMFALAVRGTYFLNPTFILIMGFMAAHSFFLYNNNRRSKVWSYLIWQRQQKYYRLRSLLAETPQREQTHSEQMARLNPRISIARVIYRKIRWIWAPQKYLVIVYLSALLDILHWVPVFYGITTGPLFIVEAYHQVRYGDRWVEPYLMERQTATEVPTDHIV